MANVSFGGRLPQNVMVYNASIFSQLIYDPSNKDNNYVPEGFTVDYHHLGSPEECRITNWAIYSSEELQTIYVVFRGTRTALDWTSNVGITPAVSSHHPNVEIHAGYANEIDREYQYILDSLRAFSSEKFKTVILSGHSKGGALAQVLTHRIVNDMQFRSGVFDYVDMFCVTFSASLVFWIQNDGDEEKVNTKHLMHNYFIRGDPVPVAQLLLVHNPEAIRRAVSGGRVGSFLLSPVFHLTGGNQALVDAAAYITRYRPVGRIYVAYDCDVSCTEFELVNFTNIDKSLKDWNCVSDVDLSIDNHAIKHHCLILGKDKYHELERAKNHKCGLYVQNDSQDTILFVMTLAKTPVSCIRVPPGKTCYLASSNVFHSNVSVQEYHPWDVPILLQDKVRVVKETVSRSVAMSSVQMALVNPLTIWFTPLILLDSLNSLPTSVANIVDSTVQNTVNGVAMVGGATVAAFSTPDSLRNGDFISGVLADGRTVKVSRAYTARDKKHYMLELSDFSSSYFQKKK